MAVIGLSPVLEAQALSRHFGGLRAVEGVDIQVDSGEVVGIAGPNGAGKSTLLDLLSGRQRPAAGEVFLHGHRITQASSYVRARLGIARSYQAPQTAEGLTVGQIADAARVAHGHHIDAGRAAEVFKFFGLDEGSSRLAAGLDTLARRKLLLACQLLRQPKILLLDEPCSGLLSEEIEELEHLVRVLCVHGAPFIDPIPALIIEHRLEFLAALSTRTVVMDEGRIIADGLFKEVFARPEVRRAYFLTDDSVTEVN
jgi:branched-chain amino acid transport system ATP-binding protein